MADLIKMVSGGYEVVESGRFIPARNLIPFGSIHEVPNAVRHRTANLIQGSVSGGEVEGLLKQYAEEMGADYFTQHTKYHTRLGGFFETNYKKAKVIEVGKIQLYVEANSDEAKAEDKGA